MAATRFSINWHKLKAPQKKEFWLYKGQGLFSVQSSPLKFYPRILTYVHAEAPPALLSQTSPISTWREQQQASHPYRNGMRLCFTICCSFAICNISAWAALEQAISIQEQRHCLHNLSFLSKRTDCCCNRSDHKPETQTCILEPVITITAGKL